MASCRQIFRAMSPTRRAYRTGSSPAFGDPSTRSARSGQARRRGARSGQGVSHEPTAVYVPAALEDGAHGFGIETMFLLEDPGRERFRRVGILDRDGGLRHDRPAVQFACDEMNGDAADLDAM